MENKINFEKTVSLNTIIVFIYVIHKTWIKWFSWNIKFVEWF
jgi:hypothetical protein